MRIVITIVLLLFFGTMAGLVGWVFISYYKDKKKEGGNE